MGNCCSSCLTFFQRSLDFKPSRGTGNVAPLPKPILGKFLLKHYKGKNISFFDIEHFILRKNRFLYFLTK